MQELAEREGLRLVLGALDGDKPAAPPENAFEEYGPLIERAPQQMPQIVRQQYETAAKNLEQAADALEAEMQSQVTLMRDEAGSIRAMGESQAVTIEQASLLIRDVNRVFKGEADKLHKFRAGIAA